jgi:flavin-dependent dehydrogenase
MPRADNLQCDVLVIGAGPAGCSAAITAARAGNRTLLVEKASFPREKVCGCCLSPAGLRALAELDGERHDGRNASFTQDANASPDGSSSSDTTSSRSAHVHSRLVDFIQASGPSLHSSRVLSLGKSARFTLGTKSAAPGAPQGAEAGVAISRAVLDTAMLQTATRAGVQVLLQHAACIINEGDSASLAHAELCDISGNAIGTFPARARCIVACDGLTGSCLPVHDRWEVRVNRHSPIGFGTHASESALREAMHDCFGLNSKLVAGEIAMHVASNGYVGLVMLDDGSVSIACALRRATHSARPPHAQAADIIAHAYGKPDAPTALTALFATLRWRGAPPLTRSRCTAFGRVIVAGDAAGYVEPFSGEGMTWALQAGAAAGTHASLVANNRLAPTKSAAQWSCTLQTLLNTRHARCRVLARVAQSPLLVAGACVVVDTLPHAGLLLQRGLAGLWSAPSMRSVDGAPRLVPLTSLSQSSLQLPSRLQSHHAEPSTSLDQSAFATQSEGA